MKAPAAPGRFSCVRWPRAWPTDGSCRNIWKILGAPDFLRPQVASEVEEWLSSLWVSPINPGGLAPKTVRGIWSQLGRVFHRARKWVYLDRKPIEMVDLAAGSTKRRAKPLSLTPEHYLALLSLYGPLERAAIAISGWLGTRRSEAFGLQWRDFDFQARTVHFERGIVHGRITPLKNKRPVAA
jgi:integrase